MSLVSVVIPCFNQGHYVVDAVRSVQAQSCQEFEIIIVNDGSNDGETPAILERLDVPKMRVLHTENHGLAAARNHGIASAGGKYILPLDADDLIGARYLEKAVSVLDASLEVGFVYCLADLFGARRGKFYLNEGTLSDMLLDSRVFCSAMFRKSDWISAGGYNPNMRFGWEDWDFWLSLMEQGKKPYLIPEVLFHYRVKPGSMIRSMTPERKLAMHLQLFENHRDLYIQNMELIFREYHRLKSSRYNKFCELMKTIIFNLRYWGR